MKHSYLTTITNADARARVIAEVARRLPTFFPDVQAIAFTGLSGALLAPSVADRLGLDLIAVRKATVNAHSANRIEAPLEPRRYVILDDFIQSGDTLRVMANVLHDKAPQHSCIGIFLWNEPDDIGARFETPSGEVPIVRAALCPKPA